MNKVILDTKDFTFDASTKTIEFSQDIENITLQNLLLVTNVTDNTIIYNFGCDGFGGTIVRNTITLDYNTAAMADTDDLQIIVYREKSPFELEYLEKNLEQRLILQTLKNILEEQKKTNIFLENIAT